MTSFNAILAATDFSADGNNAVRRAALLAHLHGAQLHILHVLKDAGCRPLREWFTPVVDIDLKAALARAALRRVAVEIAGAYDVKTTVEVKVGDPLRLLMQASERADLVVLGRRGHSRLETLLIGRTADRMLRTCRRPVLVVRKAADMPYGNVLMPVDFSACSDAAVLAGTRLARDARVHMLHATDSYVESMLRRAGAAAATIEAVSARAQAGLLARMRRTAARLGLGRAATSFSVRRGPAHVTTLACADALRADLIVAGKQGQSRLGGFLLGSVSRSVLGGADCDMLIVPRPPEVALPNQAGANTAAATAHWMQHAPGFARRRPS